MDPALRSRARVRTSPKFHLVDPALAAAALTGTGPILVTDDGTVTAPLDTTSAPDTIRADTSARHAKPSESTYGPSPTE